MLNDQRASAPRENQENHEDDQRASAPRENQENHEDDQEDIIRDIYALTPPHPQPPNHRSQRSSSLSIASSDGVSSELFSTMSREFNALVLAGSTIANSGGENNNGANNNNNLGRIGEEEMHEETNPLAIVPDNNPYNGPVSSLNDGTGGGSSGGGSSSISSSSNTSRAVSVQSVKKEEVETKISAWQNAKIAKLNNRFKREDAIINGWESEQVQKSTSWMKKIERKLEEKRARALEKTQNDIAKAHRKAEERRASAEARRGTKMARVFEIANLMRAVGRPPAKRSFF